MEQTIKWRIAATNEPRQDIRHPVNNSVQTEDKLWLNKEYKKNAPNVAVTKLSLGYVNVQANGVALKPEMSGTIASVRPI